MSMRALILRRNRIVSSGAPRRSARLSVQSWRIKQRSHQGGATSPSDLALIRCADFRHPWHKNFPPPHRARCQVNSDRVERGGEIPAVRPRFVYCRQRERGSGLERVEFEREVRDTGVAAARGPKMPPVPCRGRLSSHPCFLIAIESRLDSASSSAIAVRKVSALSRLGSSPFLPLSGGWRFGSPSFRWLFGIGRLGRFLGPWTELLFLRISCLGSLCDSKYTSKNFPSRVLIEACFDLASFSSRVTLKFQAVCNHDPRST